MRLSIFIAVVILAFGPGAALAEQGRQVAPGVREVRLDLPKNLTHKLPSDSGGQLSPDNRWLAYTSDVSGELQVYVQDFPGMTWRRQVSRDSAAQPRWTGDGQGLVFLTQDMVLREARLSFADGRVEITGESDLFRLESASSGYDLRTHLWGMTPDGERFLYFTSSSESRLAEPFHMILGWRPEE